MNIPFLKDVDYENKDGSWTRFPSQLWIESKIEKQSAQNEKELKNITRMDEPDY